MTPVCPHVYSVRMADEKDLVVGDRVWLLLRPVNAPRRGEQKTRHEGIVIGVDDLIGTTGQPIRGIRIELNQPALTPTCYATHDEVHRADASRPAS